MRTNVSLFVVSALLFVFGVAFAVVGARDMRRAPDVSAASPAAAIPPLATTGQIMTAIVTPASNAIFQSVQTNVTQKGVEEIFPRNEDEWAALGAQAAVLGEAGTMLMTEGRAVDRNDWITMSQAMVDAAKQTLKAVQDKKPEDVLTAGERVNTSCDNCHERYRRQ